MNNGGGDTAGDAERHEEVMKHLRRVHIKRLVKNPPPGFRVSDDGESVVPDGDRNWPAKPFDPFCLHFCWPDAELFAL
jgi:hypothetical protein